MAKRIRIDRRRRPEMRLYHSWWGMVDRCTNNDSKHHHRYGGRGISVDPSWMEFGPFRNWALANGYESTLTIERINNDGGYSPANCRWATRKEQAQNRSTTRIVEYAGETLRLRDLCAEKGISASTVIARLNLGWPVHIAVNVPTLTPSQSASMQWKRFRDAA